MIPVCWWEKDRMSYSCTHLLNQMFDLYHCVHYSRSNPMPEVNGCIFVFHGGNMCIGNMGERAASMFNNMMRDKSWIIFVSIGDEASEFPVHLLKHPNMKLWVQAPLPTTKADRYLIQGYPANTKRADEPKNLDWAFAGQVTHARRYACVHELIELIPGYNSAFYPSNSFAAGLPPEDYLALMSRTKIAPCPSGPMTPDTFRVYEALECGAIPILDAVSLRPETRGVWPLLLGDHPLPLIEDWDMLPEVMEPLLEDWERQSALVGMWWRAYKAQMRNWLAQDLVSLGAFNERKEEASARVAETP